MARRADETEHEIEALLQRGLDLYGQNRVLEAIECWQRVLELNPDELRARDYLDTAGSEANIDIDTPRRGSSKVIELHAARENLSQAVYDSNPSVRVNGRQIVELIESKQYEEALTLLYAARKQAPQDPSVSRSIKLVKDRLTLEYVRRVGSLDQVPVVTASEATVRGLRLSADENELLDLVDGIGSVGDIQECSRLGRFKTYQGLARFLDMGLVALKPEPQGESVLAHTAAPKPAPTGASSPPPAPSEAPVSRGATGAEAPDEYTELFNRATRAYLKRDFNAARALFRQCLERRPDDARARHNLEKLRGP